MSSISHSEPTADYLNPAAAAKEMQQPRSTTVGQWHRSNRFFNTPRFNIPNSTSLSFFLFGFFLIRQVRVSTWDLLYGSRTKLLHCLIGPDLETTTKQQKMRDVGYRGSSPTDDLDSNNTSDKPNSELMLEIWTDASCVTIHRATEWLTSQEHWTHWSGCSGLRPTLEEVKRSLWR